MRNTRRTCSGVNQRRQRHSWPHLQVKAAAVLLQLLQQFAGAVHSLLLKFGQLPWHGGCAADGGGLHVSRCTGGSSGCGGGGSSTEEARAAAAAGSST